MSAPVEVDLVLCKACGICVALCPEKVFDADKGGIPLVARPADCTQCLICELHCPDFAIAVKRRAKKPAVDPPAVDPTKLVTVSDVCTHDGQEG